MVENLKFRISSALKDILGRDLITDDFMAVFELVKNSYDAHATIVEIKFEDIESGNGRIIIKDNGKGMNYSDLLNKWLFVAYSAKREGTEDDNFDYRNSIHSNRPFAGAKGIGRFSCDKLGKQLYLETTKQETYAKTETLLTEWEKFEGDLKEEFIDINVLHKTIDRSNHGLEHGTVLVIEKLRSEWPRWKYLKLKDSLAKLINPKKNRGDNEFKILIDVPEELQRDFDAQEEYQKVNGEIHNFIFEALDLKTTKIIASVTDDGKYVTTSLFDGGTLIYKIKEVNEFTLLDNIDYTIYYLNMSAKLTFTRRMGLSSRQFGHIFLYKNGFRVYPFGEPGEDPLKIDVRKAQGMNRFLGTRELIGQIEIFSSTNELKETSSRGDGLIKTKTYYQLEECFWKVLKRLEKYVVDVQHWGISIEDASSDDINSRITELISKLADSNDIVEFDYSKNILEKIESAQAGSAAKLVDNLKRIAIENGNDALLGEANSLSGKIQQLKSINEEIVKEKEYVVAEKKVIEEKLEIKDREIELLKEASSDEIVELLSIEHHINQATFRVDGYIRGLYEIAKENKNIENQIIDIINNISLENKKIASLVKFVRRANFDLLSSKITQDLVIYIDQYVKNVYRNDRVRRINKKLVKNVNVLVQPETSFVFEFTPLEINIILDNLLDNSFKASAETVEIKISVVNQILEVEYQDNGIGVNPSIIETMFDFGVTTTSGSGIGLYHVKKIVQSMGGEIVYRISKYGANFLIKIPKKNQHGTIQNSLV